jgi:carbon storage regulator
MLVLTRKPNETIELSGGITVRVNSIMGNRVQLGIDAPQTVDIKRGEIKGKPKPKPMPRPQPRPAA